MASPILLNRRELALGAAALTVGCAHAGDTSDSAGDRAIIRERMARDGLVGVSAALMHNGRLAWMEGFGHADRARQIPMTPQTPVGIGSVTKAFTALALMQLHSRGHLDLSAPLHRVLPAFRIGMRGFDPDDVTIRAIATHTSGLPTSVFKHLGLDGARYTDAAALLQGSDIAAGPSTTGLYSNIGYSLLGDAIRATTGNDYLAYVRAHILEPLGMVNSGFAGERALPTPALNYYPGGRETTPFELRDQPAGGLYASVEDLMRYARGVIQAWRGRAPGLLPSAPAREMFALQNGHIPIETNKKGFGWFMFHDGAQFAMYHAGSTVFSNAALLVLPEQGSAVAIGVNTVGGDQLAQDFAFAVLERNGIAPSSIRPNPHLPPIDERAQEIERPDDDLDHDAGDYAQKNRYITVVRSGSVLLALGQGDPITLRPLSNGAYRVYAESEGRLRTTGEERRFVDVGPYHVMFHRTADGETALGYRIPASRIDVAPQHGSYTHTGYQMPGAEQILNAHIELADGRLPMLRLGYNTGDYSYPLIFETNERAITGGLGPELTGETVRFADGGRMLIYSGLTFQRD